MTKDRLKTAMAQAARQLAQDVAWDVSQLKPVDTGRLRGSIDSR